MFLATCARLSWSHSAFESTLNCSIVSYHINIMTVTAVQSAGQTEHCHCSVLLLRCSDGCRSVLTVEVDDACTQQFKQRPQQLNHDLIISLQTRPSTPWHTRLISNDALSSTSMWQRWCDWWGKTAPTPCPPNQQYPNLQTFLFCIPHSIALPLLPSQTETICVFYLLYLF